MRRGFTMIELIFVIVIIGILAAVAIPKLQGVSEDAEIAKLQAYAGTLSRTIMPGIWSKSLRENRFGKIEDYSEDIKRDLPAPRGLTDPAFDADNLEPAGTDFRTSGAPGSSIATELIGDTTYTVACTNGDSTRSPVCDVWDETRWLLASKTR